LELRHGLDLRLEQRLKLAPQIIQSIEILQLPMMELRERIEQELEENPVLEATEPQLEMVASEEEAEGEERRAEQEEFSDELEQLLKMDEEWREYLSRTTSPAAAREETERKAEALENTADRPPTLQDHLLEQLAFFDVPERVLKAARLIILDLDENGYLLASLEEITPAEEEFSTEEVEQALALVQGLDPPGVGARDLQECLLLQLGRMGDHDSLAVRLVKEHFENIRKNKLPKIVRATGESMEAVKEAVATILSLNPKPGAAIGGETAPHVIPDVVVVYENGKYDVEIQENTLPILRISPTYRRMLAEKGESADVRKYVRRKIESARWLMDAIEQRKRTLRRVSKAIVDFQTDFMESGRGHVRPLKMQRVADAVGVHVSTVSRAIADKYVDTPQGIFPLRYFFSGGTMSQDGQLSSWKTVKEPLGDLIEKEDKKNPLSDEQIAEALHKEGYDVARRTVTKYRKALAIRSSRQRKEY